MRYIAFGQPEAWPIDVLLCFPFHQRPPFSEVRELANNSKGRLHTTHAGILLLVRQLPRPDTPTTQRPVGCTYRVLNDDHIQISVPLLMRVLVMQACHSTACCHLEAAHTLRMI